jgi:hypothetical protein
MALERNDVIEYIEVCKNVMDWRRTTYFRCIWMRTRRESGDKGVSVQDVRPKDTKDWR